ncbi:proline-rich protein 2-like [Balaenoptera musculus]|uniref:Proline-rich protein 2-like n=1 Tax=Balaenoptera musculus TaxID=9771 RepID=A0A8B8V378_BALMU|nr:proline-rich protein 2-like [Balaenoptera musculus]
MPEAPSVSLRTPDRAQPAHPAPILGLCRNSSGTPKLCQMYPRTSGLRSVSRSPSPADTDPPDAAAPFRGPSPSPSSRDLGNSRLRPERGSPGLCGQAPSPGDAGKWHVPPPIAGRPPGAPSPGGGPLPRPPRPLPPPASPPSSPALARSLTLSPARGAASSWRGQRRRRRRDRDGTGARAREPRRRRRRRGPSKSGQVRGRRPGRQALSPRGPRLPGRARPSPRERAEAQPGKRRQRRPPATGEERRPGSEP